ncbi:ArsR/SmtB family transcription factor [Micromonospora sp. LOL_015]|uniref:ArsR/SmtB family transcription factor n=1 Tax=Micromonospora sp. LOL_015 TaxID=3345416 RepID=UPI003A891A87
MRLPAEVADRQAHQGEGVTLPGRVRLSSGEQCDFRDSATMEEPLAADWTEMAGQLGALGHPVRLLLLRQILAGVRHSADLAVEAGLGMTSQLYYHLRQLISGGWLHTPSRGVYAARNPRVVALLVILAEIRCAARS